MPLPLTVSCSSKIQIGFTFLVPAYPGCPGKEAVKWLLVIIFSCKRFHFFQYSVVVDCKLWTATVSFTLVTVSSLVVMALQWCKKGVGNSPRAQHARGHKTAWSKIILTDKHKSEKLAEWPKVAYQSNLLLFLWLPTYCMIVTSLLYSIVFYFWAPWAPCCGRAHGMCALGGAHFIASALGRREP